MSQTPSNMLPLGTIAPEFSLIDVQSGKYVSLKESHAYNAIVIMFICNHCPYVMYLQSKLVEVAKKYLPQGVKFIAISSNDAILYPQDGPEKMREIAIQNGYPFPYLYDESQDVAKNYQAACTPDFYIFDNDLKCVYRGRFDDATPGNGNPVTGKDLTNALDNIIANKPVDSNQKPSVGCNIKWKKN